MSNLSRLRSAPTVDSPGASHYYIPEQLFDGLVRLDENFNVLPALAEYWVISNEGRKFTFYLRRGVKFHHGREMIADDVKFSLESLIRKGSGDIYCQYFTSKVVGAAEFHEGNASEVSGFKVIDRYTFEIDWLRPYVSGLYLLSMSFCKIVPRDLVKAEGKNFYLHPTGTGPFRFAYWLRNKRLDIVGVRMERNDDYFGELPYLDAVEFSHAFTEEEFLSGEVHIMPLPSENLAAAGFRVLESPSLDITFLSMSCDVAPLDRIEVRKAIRLALNKERIAETARTVESVPKPINNYIPANLPGFFPIENSGGPDAAEAEKILENEGFPHGRGIPVILVCFLHPKTEIQSRIFREIQRDLELLGIRTEMKLIRSLEEAKSIKRPCLTALEWLMDFPDPENIILPLFESKAVMNKLIMRYSNPVLDKLMRESEIEASWEKRTGLFRKMERILFEDVPAVPLFGLKLRMALQSYVRGAKAPPLAFYYFDVKDIWLDK